MTHLVERRAGEGWSPHRPPEEAAFLAAYAYEAHNNTPGYPVCCIRRDDRTAWPNEQAPRARTFAAPPPQDSMHPKTGPGLHLIASSVIVVVYRRPVGAVFGRIGRAAQRGIRAVLAQAAEGPFSPSSTGPAESPWPSLLGRTGGFIA